MLSVGRNVILPFGQDILFTITVLHKLVQFTVTKSLIYFTQQNAAAAIIKHLCSYSHIGVRCNSSNTAHITEVTESYDIAVIYTSAGNTYSNCGNYHNY